MKKILLFTLCFLVLGITFAQEEEFSKEEKERREKNIQAGNPFAEFGYKAKVATLSKGKYLEVHDLDSIVKIGSSLWHVRKQKIVGNVQQDTTDIYRQPLFETAGRWLSPDPLAEEFPEWSPYNYTMNNPIKYTDPTGLAPESCCGINPGGWLGTGGLLLQRTAEIIKRKSNGESWASAYANTYKNDAKNIVRYGTPVEDVYGVATGQDFDGNDYNRAEAGAWAAASFIPFAKLGKLGKLATVVTKNGNEVLEFSNDASKAFMEAASGGKHSKTLEFALDRTLKQNQSSIKSFEKQISKHEGYINNPKSKFDNWDNFTDNRKQRELNHWNTEITGFKEQIDITRDVINNSN
jgi:hypothetical protein